MHHSITHAFASDTPHVLLIGSDIPDLPTTYLKTAFDRLHTHDLVLGPTTDGGYYLIACKKDRYLPQIFTDIPWSTPAVLQKTLDIIHRHHHTVHLLPPWQDIDTPSDLTALIHRNQNTAFKSSQTFTYLTKQKPMEEPPP